MWVNHEHYYVYINQFFFLVLSVFLLAWAKKQQENGGNTVAG
jgi:hypothetical protein